MVIHPKVSLNCLSAMKLQINSNQFKYFRQVLELLSPFAPFNTISGREKDVLSQLLTYNWTVIDLTKEERDSYVFSKAAKEKMRKTLNISKPSFDNQMAALRRKGFITYDAIVAKHEMRMDTELTFTFQIQ